MIYAATDDAAAARSELAPGLPAEDRQPSIPPGPRVLAIPEGEVVRRVDRFVADRTGLSRSYVQRLISDGRLVDDAGRRLRANSEVRGGTVVLEVPPPEVPYHLEPDPTIEVRVVYEDDDLLIVDKPAGLVVHPAPGHWRGTLVNGLLARGDHYGGIAGVARPGIVHRLDRDTSGLLIVARNDAAQSSLMAQLKARRVRKTYLALVQGSVSASVGRIEAPIGRDPKDRKRMAVVPDGRRAVTGYRVRERFHGWTLLELDLVTGRTHQIRVHLAAIGHSVAGDSVYGTGTAERGPGRISSACSSTPGASSCLPVVGAADPRGGAAAGVPRRPCSRGCVPSMPRARAAQPGGAA